MYSLFIMPRLQVVRLLSHYRTIFYDFFFLSLWYKVHRAATHTMEANTTETAGVAMSQTCVLLLVNRS